ncbi:hypothetical protein BK139_03020 [Paenibacillus sp. FSL R5-0490]|uniref:hypothetical protein n=1 Tax=Bacillales TaxID=1385 RepID=UPI00096E31AD|nr:hypothetical protein [Paenibacillus sp. FSL R5-0490]OMF62361.1 hypothetical protein BK139_03020 [Paenibacillus sp. FSL R5-0490]
MLDKDKEKTEDPLTHFLFGNKRAEGFDSSAEEGHGNDDWLFGGRSRNAHEADDWLLGGKSIETTERESSGKKNENNILNNINVEELMGNIDTLMSSAHHLKPLLKKAGPLLEMFWKK